jgi:hypothetical protein
MSKYYSPRDYDVIGIGKNRRYIPITDEEVRKRAAKKKKLKNSKSKKVNYYYD